MPSLIRKSPRVVAQHAAPLHAQSPLLRRRASFSSSHTLLERSAKCFEAAVKPRLHGGKRNAEYSRHLVDLQLFLEAEDEHLAINCGDFLQRCLDGFFLLLAEDLVQWRGVGFVHELQRMLLFGIRQRVQTLRLLSSLPINDQVACDGEEPGFKLRLAVVLVATLEDADPRLLEKVFGPLSASRDVDEIAEQAVLILLDQAVEQVGVALLQSARDAF